LINFIIFALGTIGLTNIVVEGKIMEWPRKKLKIILPSSIYYLLTCHQCAGVWCGGFCAWAVLTTDWWMIAVAAFAGSFLAQFAVIVEEYITFATGMTFEE